MDLQKIDRVQLSRTKGSKLPKNTLIVDRRSEFGNIFKMVDPKDPECRQVVVRRFREWLCKREQQPLRVKFLRTIKIRQIEHLACWCPVQNDEGEKVPCHADVWLEYLRGLLVVDDRPALTEEAIQVLEQVFPAVKE